MTPKDDALRREAQLFSRYLIGTVPAELILERYEHAIERLFEAKDSSAVLRYARRHAWTLPYLDAACGFRRPEDPLRKRLLVMAAILETTPDHAPHFLPRHLRFTPLILALAGNGLRAVLKTAIGLVLLALLPRWSPESEVR